MTLGKDGAQGKAVGIWIRVSTEDQAKGESPEHHEKRARYYAESKGWDVKEVYHLEAVSGKSVKEHPEAQRMVRDVKSGHITGLIFSKLARLARNTKELLEFADLFKEYSADLISLQEAIDTSTATGRLFYTMIAAMAEWERSEIAERVAASVPIRAKLGKPLGGAAPFGYRWVDRKLVPDPKEAPVRKRMYDLFVQHRRIRTVGRLLTEEGYRTRNGSSFSGTTIERLIRDPTAKGTRRANYTKSLGEGKKWVMKPENDWVLIDIDPIVSEELWNQSNQILDEQKKKNREKMHVARPPVNLFSGFVHCSCGGLMYVPSNSPKYVCRKCRNKIGVTDLEEIFQSQLKQFLFSEEDIRDYFGNADRLIKEKEELLTNLASEAEKIRKQMDHLVRMSYEGELPEKGFHRHYAPLEERLGQIEDQIPQLQGEIDFLKIQYLSSDEVVNEAKDLSAHWPNLTPVEKRSIVETIVEKIEVGSDEITVRLASLPFENRGAFATQPCSCVAILPVTLNATKPTGIPQITRTYGEHIRKRRMELRLSQLKVAQILGVSECTVNNWERGRTEPTLGALPRINAFLGYQPKSAPSETLGKRIKAYRRTEGLSRKALASKLGIDPDTLGKWEHDESGPKGKQKQQFDSFFKDLMN